MPGDIGTLLGQRLAGRTIGFRRSGRAARPSFPLPGKMSVLSMKVVAGGHFTVRRVLL